MFLTVVYGGSFNPVHRGHVAAASMIAANPDVSQVLVVPTAAHPDKNDLVDFETRYWLLKLAMPEDNKLQVSRAEQDMLNNGHEGPLYTYDLLRYLSSQNSGCFRFAVGPDLLDAPSKWHMGQQVADEFGFYELPSFGAARSTVIRERVREGRSLERYTPSRVAEEIVRQGLYL